MVLTRLPFYKESHSHDAERGLEGRRGRGREARRELLQPSGGQADDLSRSRALRVGDGHSLVIGPTGCGWWGEAEIEEGPRKPSGGALARLAPEPVPQTKAQTCRGRAQGGLCSHTAVGSHWEDATRDPMV